MRAQSIVRVAPLVLATMASQALLVVLAPIIAAVGADLGASVAAVGQARTVTSVAAISASVAITARIGAIGVRRLLVIGAVLTLPACGAVASAGTLGVFLAAHVLVGVALACLLTAGFAGVAAFPAGERGWAIGYVAGANALAWILVSPAAGGITQLLSWRFAQWLPAVIAAAALLAAPALRAMTGVGGEPHRRLPLRILLADRSALRWIAAELLAYASWTGLLTFVGAFFIERVGIREAATGWLLAAGAAAYFAASTRTAALVARLPRRRVVAGSALVMAALLPVLLVPGEAGVAWGAVLFCLAGLTAGVRTPSSSGLGLEQLPGHPGAMMAIRTAVTQLGYLFGAVVGGVVIAAAGYGALGVVLGASMALSALLVLGVRDPARPAAARAGGR